MNSKDCSLLSDDLKPRRTPQPASFKDFVPRPTVPDLSIIEIPTSSSSSPSVALRSCQTDSLKSKNSGMSYREWKKQTEGVNHVEQISEPPISSNVVIPSLEASVPHSNALNTKKIVLDRLSDPPLRLSDSAPSLGQPVTYRNFEQRPMSAPTHQNRQQQDIQRHRFLNGDLQTASVKESSYDFGCRKQGLDREDIESASHGFNQMDLSKMTSNQILIPWKQCQSTNFPAACRENYSPVTSAKKPNSVNNRKLSGNTTNDNYISDHSLVPQIQHGNPYNFQEVSHPHVFHGHSHIPGAACNHPPVFACCGCGTCAQSPPHQVRAEKLPKREHGTYDDIYRIVLAQSKQLKMLQSQVEKLLVSHEQQQQQQQGASTNPATQSLSCPSRRQEHCKMVCEEGTQTSDYEMKSDDGDKKVSIGVMTSCIHTVAYSGRMIDAMHNIKSSQHFNGPEEEQIHFDHHRNSSSPLQSSSSSAPENVSQHAAFKKQENSCCCAGQSCARKKKKHFNVKNKTEAKQLISARPNSVKTSFNDPGMSDAIKAVRGCQAMLASTTGIDESLTFNGVDLPTVTEQPASPVSSIHVNIHDYQDSSSNDESSCADDERDSSSKESAPCGVEKVAKTHPQGWTLYNKVLGQVNQFLNDGDGRVEERKQNDYHQRRLRNKDSNSDDSGNAHNVSFKDATNTSVKSKDVHSTLKRVAFHNDSSAPNQDLKELALRFLQENYPEELATGHSTSGKNGFSERVQDVTLYNMSRGFNNMSFATFRYLERYNLLPENFNLQQYPDTAPGMNVNGFPGAAHYRFNNEDHLDAVETRQHQKHFSAGRKKGPHQAINAHKSHSRLQSRGRPSYAIQPGQHHAPNSNVHHNAPGSKILDITALRHQPKLL